MSKYSYQIPIITLIASLAAHSSSQVHPGQSWTAASYRQFTTTKIGKSLVRKVEAENRQRQKIIAKVANKVSAKSGGTVTGSDKASMDALQALQAQFESSPELAEANAKYERELREDRGRAEKELKLGHYDKVVAILQPRLNARPDEVLSVDHLADAYLHQGKIDDAYYALMPSVGASNGSNEHILVRASLALALKGEVEAGQWEYCIDSINHVVQEDVTMKDGIPKIRNLRNLQMLSYLAVGLECDTHARSDSMTVFYLKKALALDPGNPIASAHIVQPLMRKERYEDALVYLEKGLPRAHGRYKDALETEHAKLKYIVNSRKATSGGGGI